MITAPTEKLYLSSKCQKYNKYELRLFAKFVRVPYDFDTIVVSMSWPMCARAQTLIANNTRTHNNYLTKLYRTLTNCLYKVALGEGDCLNNNFDC